MNSTNWIIGLVAVVVIAGGAYYFAQPKGGAMTEGAMAGKAMHNDAMATDTMMATSSDSVMQGEVMASTSANVMTH